MRLIELDNPRRLGLWVPYLSLRWKFTAVLALRRRASSAPDMRI